MAMRKYFAQDALAYLSRGPTIRFSSGSICVRKDHHFALIFDIPITAHITELRMISSPDTILLAIMTRVIETLNRHARLWAGAHVPIKIFKSRPETVNPPAPISRIPGRAWTFTARLNSNIYTVFYGSATSMCSSNLPSNVSAQATTAFCSSRNKIGTSDESRVSTRTLTNPLRIAPFTIGATGDNSKTTKRGRSSQIMKRWHAQAPFLEKGSVDVWQPSTETRLSRRVMTPL